MTTAAINVQSTHHSGICRVARPIVSLLVSTALAGSFGHGALAQAAPSGSQNDADIPSLDFSIPAQPLAQAITTFSRVTNIDVVGDGAVGGNLTSPAVVGRMPASQALARLLRQTNLTYHFTSASAVAIQRPTTIATAGPASDDGVTLDMITVQGEKFARDTFRTYSSVGVVTDQDLKDYNTYDVSDAYNRLANVRSFPTGAGNSSFAIRSLNAEGVTSPSRAAPIISVIIDGAAQNVEAMRRGSRGLWDVEQIEVLRGPQSTLQGRNSLGGSVLIKTKDPTWTPEIIVDGFAGTQSLRAGAFAISSPIIPDQVAVRVSGQVLRETKNIHYTEPSVADLARDELEQIRGKLLVKPEALPGLTALFSASHTHDKPGWNFVTGPNFFARRFNPTIGYSAEYRDTRVDNFTAEISYDLAPGWIVTSLSTLSHTHLDIASPPKSVFERRDTREGHDIAQDLRLNFDPPGSAISGVVGVFAGRYTNDITSLFTTSSLAPYGIPNASVQELAAKNMTTSIAAYADLRYRFLDQWTLIGGGRILQEEVSGTYRGKAINEAETMINIGTCMMLNCTPRAAYGSLDESSSVKNSVFLPKFGVAYDLSPQQTIAATATEGFRSGFSEAVAGSTVINKIAPETLWSYELAYRSNWLDNRLNVNANAFYYDYTNQQILTYNPSFPGQTITQNGGQSHAYGAEIETRFRPIEELTLFSSIGLLRTKFEKALTTVGNLQGKQFPEAPAVTLAAGATWRHHSGIFVSTDASYTDGFYSAGDLMNTRSRFINSFFLLNAQIGYETKRGTITLFARNLLDRQYLTGIDQTLTGATIGEGRAIGIRGTTRF